ncbi:MAG: PAS domain S-box protein [Chloroflexi bacterium]|nr:PAS domain S-box protein [Chloroflexota bacterium]
MIDQTPVKRFPDNDTAQTLQAMPDAVIAVDSNGEIRFLNSPAEAMTGYACEELLGQRVDVLVPASKRNAHARQRTR